MARGARRASVRRPSARRTRGRAYRDRTPPVELLDDGQADAQLVVHDIRFGFCFCALRVIRDCLRTCWRGGGRSLSDIRHQRARGLFPARGASPSRSRDTKERPRSCSARRAALVLPVRVRALLLLLGLMLASGISEQAENLCKALSRELSGYSSLTIRCNHRPADLLCGARYGRSGSSSCTAFESDVSGPSTTQRIASLDQFRGYTVAGMCLVNFLAPFLSVPASAEVNNESSSVQLRRLDHAELLLRGRLLVPPDVSAPADFDHVAANGQGLFATEPRAVRVVVCHLRADGRLEPLDRFRQNARRVRSRADDARAHAVF